MSPHNWQISHVTIKKSRERVEQESMRDDIKSDQATANKNSRSASTQRGYIRRITQDNGMSQKEMSILNLRSRVEISKKPDLTSYRETKLHL